MVEMKELEWKKRDELNRGIAQLGISEEKAKQIFEYLEDECVIEITPPEMEEPFIQMVNIHATHTGRFSGKSYKPGNIILNIKDAMGDSLALVCSMAASIGAISVSQPVIAVLTILAAVISAANLGKIELDDNAVLILAVLWENSQFDRIIDVRAGLEHVNRYLESYNREKLSDIQYNDLLEDLRRAGSIELSNGTIRLIEKIHILY